MQWLLTAHVRRYHCHYRSGGHVWQGRFKAFPIQQDDHLLMVLRYSERNPLRAGLVAKAEDWLWSSRRGRDDKGNDVPGDASPVPLPRRWAQWVNESMTESEVARLRVSVNRGTPFGREAWTHRMAKRLGLDASLNPRGRPRRRREK